MTRLVPALRLELTLQVRQKFLHAAVFSGLIWLAVLLPMPVSLRPVAEPYVLVGDIAIIGFFFVGGTVFFEKQERTIGAIVSTPLRFWEYLAAKLTVLLAISLFVAVVVATIVHGLGYHLLPLVAGIVLGTLLMLLVGFSSSLPFASVTDWFLAAVIPLAIMLAPPVVHYSGLWPNPVLYLIPTQGPLLLLGAAFDQVSLAPWQVGYAVVYPIVCAADCAGRPRRYSAVMSCKDRVCCESDIEPCGPTGVGRVRPQRHSRHLPRSAAGHARHRTGHLDHRSRAAHAAVHRDAGAALWIRPGRILPTDPHRVPVVDQHHRRRCAGRVLGAGRRRRGHDDGAASNPGAAVGLFRLSCGHRDGGDHHLRRRDDVVQRDPRTGPGVFTDSHRTGGRPVGGGHAAADSAVANNKIQGLAMVRALGMLIAGLPCLPWFISSNWNLAFGVLPPYWAAKAFWVASDHGTWWPYLVGGAVYNLAIVWVLFRRFRAKHA